MNGAIRKSTGIYELPEVAMKKEDYSCTLCHRTVFLRRGEIYAPHFAHKHEGDPCKYYDRTSSVESSAHQTGKLIVENILKTQRDWSISSSCNRCKVVHTSQIPMNHTTVKVEGRVNGGHTDVLAVYADKEIAFEVYHTHATKHRNGEWYELTTSEIVSKYTSTGPIAMNCSRQWRCNKCEDEIKKAHEAYIRKCEQDKKDEAIRLELEQKRAQELKAKLAKEQEAYLRKCEEDKKIQMELEQKRAEEYKARTAMEHEAYLLRKQQEEEDANRSAEERKVFDNIYLAWYDLHGKRSKRYEIPKKTYKSFETYCREQNLMDSYNTVRRYHRVY